MVDPIRYFEESLKIRAICFDSGIDEETTRLICYLNYVCYQYGIHSLESEELNNQNILTLKIMLGDKTYQNENYIDPEDDKTNIILTIADTIKQTDNFLKENYGLENRMSGELKMRLKFYENKPYRDYIVNLYKQNILPKIFHYTKEMIVKALEKANSKNSEIDKMLNDLIG